MEPESTGTAPRGLYVREVLACDHVGVNLLILADVRNFFLSQPGYIVFEENLCKVLCPQCLLKATKVS
jgi:hypothetical protein